MNIRAFCRFVVFGVLCSLSFIACQKEPVSGLDREKLFTLSYGRFEDEIDLFQLDTGSSGPDTQVFMRDGMFYIANSGSRKLLQFTSYGDLLSVYYNAEYNPPPSFAQATGSSETPTGSVENTGSSVPAATPALDGNQTLPDTPGTQNQGTRTAVAHPFLHPVYLTVDYLKRLFVVDRLPSERFEFDSEEQVLLREVILRFNADGRFVDYIGQEGPGGTPFPPVTGVYSNTRNELVVTTTSQSGMRIFWYNSEGNLLYTIPVSMRNLPNPYEPSKTVMASLEKILPDPSDHRLYLKIDYYTEVIDQATQANAGIAFDRSCLYPFNVDSGKYEERIDLPVYEGVDKDNLGTLSYKKPLEFIGMTTSGWAYLITPVPEGYSLDMLDTKSNRIHRRLLSIKPEEQAYNALMLSADGILSAILATPFDASVVWWRTDTVIGEIRR